MNLEAVSARHRARSYPLYDIMSRKKLLPRTALFTLLYLPIAAFRPKDTQRRCD